MRRFRFRTAFDEETRECGLDIQRTQWDAAQFIRGTRNIDRRIARVDTRTIDQSSIDALAIKQLNIRYSIGPRPWI